MKSRQFLLPLTAAVAAAASIANAVDAAAPAAPSTRLGVAIREEINDRDRAMAARSRDLDLREKAARAYEERLKQKAAAGAPPATAGRRAPGAAPGQPAGSDVDDPYQSLARIYQAMKPAKAAIILQQLDMDVQLRVAKAMRERSTAQIIANMEPRAAAALSMSLARERAISPPGAQGSVG